MPNNTNRNKNLRLESTESIEGKSTITLGLTFLFLLGILIPSYHLFAQAPPLPQKVANIPYYTTNNALLHKIDSLKLQKDFVMTGYHKNFVRAANIWGPRLYPHGDLSIAGSAMMDYYANFNYGPFQSEACSSDSTSDIVWEYIGSDGMPTVKFRHSAAGQVHRLLLDPNYNGTTNQIIYASSSFGGLWRSEDDGNNWYVLNTDYQLPYTSVSDVAVVPNTNDTIFISTGYGESSSLYYGNNRSNVNPIFTAGVYRSMNNGENWEPINTGFLSSLGGGAVTRRLMMQPDDGNVLFCASSKGILKCTNALSAQPTWTLLDSLQGLEDSFEWRGIEFKPDDHNTLYVSGTDIYKSIDGGTSFESMTGVNSGLDLNNLIPEFPNLNYEIARINIDVNENDPDKLYAYIIVNGDATKAFIYKFNGLSWSEMYSFTGGFGSMNGYIAPGWIAIEADPTDNDVVYFGTTHVVKLTKNSDNSYTPTSMSNYTGDGYHADVHDLLVNDISTTPRLICANHGGVSVKDLPSYDRNGWSYKNDGLHLKLIWSYDHDRFDGKHYLLGLQDAGWEFSKENANKKLEWYSINRQCDGYGGQIVEDIKDIYHLNPYSSLEVFTQSDYWDNNSVGTDNVWLPISTSNSAQIMGVSKSFQMVNHPKTDDPYYTFSDIVKPSQFFVPYGQAEDIWSIESKEGVGFAEIAISPSNPNYVYLVTNSRNRPGTGGWVPSPRLYRSVNGFNNGNLNPDPETFVTIQQYIEESSIPTTIEGMDRPPITGITIDPRNENRIWISFSGYDDNYKVFYSSTGGLPGPNGEAAWVSADPEHSLDNLPVNNIVYQEGSNDRIFIGTDAGVYYKDADMNCWQKYGKLPNVRVTELKINPCTGRLSAATFGRGIWEVALPATGLAGNDLKISQDTDWLGEIFNRGNIIVESGVTLNIYGWVHMPHNTKISVEKGAILNVDGGTITNACNAKWQGIEVVGDATLNQIGKGNQGKMVLKNNARIENAVNGVALIGHDVNGDIQWGTAGGILQAKNTTFYNCRRAVEVMAYHHYSPSGNILQGNKSYLKGCTIEVDDQYNDLFGGDAPIRGITLWGVDRFNIQNCTFKNSMGLDNGPGMNSRHDGVGITVWNASMRLKAYYEAPGNSTKPKEESYYQRNTIAGFDRGIVVKNWDDFTPMLIDRTDFSDNYVGAEVFYAESPQITHNTFSIPTYAESTTNPNEPGLQIKSVGLYLNASTYFELEENSFLGSYTNNHSDAGLIIENSGEYDNVVYRNSFDRLGLATAVYGLNSNEWETNSSQFTGLELRCNDYGQNFDNHQDIYLHSGASIDNIQGLTGEEVTAPAGNRFSTNPSAGALGHFFIGGNSFQLDKYYHHQEDITNPIHSDQFKVHTVIAAPFFGKDRTNPCPPNFALEGNTLVNVEATSAGMFNTIQVLRQELSNLESTYAKTLNRGIRPRIMDAIQDSQEYQELLMQGSPYLEDEVLIKSITRNPAMDSWELTDILLRNAPLSSEVLEALAEVNVLSAFQYNRVADMEGSSQRLKLELGIKAKREELGAVQGDYLKLIFEDDKYLDPYQKVIALFDGNTSPRAQRYTITALLKQAKTKEASDLLRKYVADSNKDHFAEFKTIEIDLMQRGENWFQMTSAEKESIAKISSDETKRGYEAARSVLDLIENNNPTSFVKSYNNRSTVDDDSPISSWNAEESPKLLEAYPQPANSELYFHAQLPSNFDNAGIKLVDVSGKTVAYIKLNGAPLQQILIAQYASGIYFAELIIDGESVESLKISIVH